MSPNGAHERRRLSVSQRTLRTGVITPFLPKESALFTAFTELITRRSLYFKWFIKSHQKPSQGDQCSQNSCIRTKKIKERYIGENIRLTKIYYEAISGEQHSRYTSS